MGQTGHKMLLVLAFSVERMIAVCYPFLVRSTLCFRFRGRSPASRAKHICFFAGLKHFLERLFFVVAGAAIVGDNLLDL